LQPADNAVQLDHVVFGYGDRAPVLDGVDLELEPGTVTALVEPSGSGKTTVTRLIARFWDANQGAVRIGGVDVKDLSDEYRAAQLSLVFQDAYLFNESLRENIALGDPDASESEVLHAAELAQVTPIAERIPGGWDGSVGEGGKLLSGGDRQCVSIARALLKKAPILLLDEAIAALDGPYALPSSRCEAKSRCPSLSIRPKPSPTPTASRSLSTAASPRSVLIRSCSPATRATPPSGPAASKPSSGSLAAVM
jgi:ABC-type multidrug transport system fused ATPase/permease subunit